MKTQERIQVMSLEKVEKEKQKAYNYYQRVKAIYFLKKDKLKK